MATNILCLVRGHQWIPTEVEIHGSTLMQCTRCGYFRTEEQLRFLGEP